MRDLHILSVKDEPSPEISELEAPLFWTRIAFILAILRTSSL